MANIVTFFAKRSYASLGAGNFAISSTLVKDLIEAECFIVYTDTGLGNTFAVQNIALTIIDEHNVRVSFDPLTDVHAMPASILPKSDLLESACAVSMQEDEVKDVPRFNVVNVASGNNPNVLALNIDCRHRFMQYAAGLCTLTDLVLELYQSGIHVCDIHNGVKQKSNYHAVLGQHPRVVFDLNKDNGLVNDQNMPLLAAMVVLL